MPGWSCIWHLFTRDLSHMGVPFTGVQRNSPKKATWLSTCESTRVRGHFSAATVTICSPQWAIRRITSAAIKTLSKTISKELPLDRIFVKTVGFPITENTYLWGTYQRGSARDIVKNLRQTYHPLVPITRLTPQVLLWWLKLNSSRMTLKIHPYYTDMNHKKMQTDSYNLSMILKTTAKIVCLTALNQN